MPDMYIPLYLIDCNIIVSLPNVLKIPLKWSSLNAYYSINPHWAIREKNTWLQFEMTLLRKCRALSHCKVPNQAQKVEIIANHLYYRGQVKHEPRLVQRTWSNEINILGDKFSSNMEWFVLFHHWFCLYAIAPSIFVVQRPSASVDILS